MALGHTAATTRIRRKMQRCEAKVPIFGDQPLEFRVPMGIDPVPTGSDCYLKFMVDMFLFFVNMTHITSLQLGTCM